MAKDKPILEYNSRGESGNIFWILGMLSEIMKKQRRITAFNSIRDRVFASKSYDEALAIIGEEVTLKDIAKE